MSASIAMMRVRAIVIVVAVLFVVACGGGTDGGRQQGNGPNETANGNAGPGNLPTVAAGLHGAGTVLRDGFSVVPGTWLLGAVMPGVQGLYQAQQVTGWNAVLIVDDDPLGALQSYLEQAKTAGLTELVAMKGIPNGPCVGESTPLRNGESPRYVDVSRVGGRADRVTCALMARRPAAEGAPDIAYFELYMGKPYDCNEQCQQSYASDIEISVSHAQPGTDSLFAHEGQRPAPPDLRTLVMPTLPAPAGALRLPHTGERIGVDQAFFDALELQPGSTVIAPGGPLNSGGTGNYSVFLEITEDPRAVLEAYGSAFRAQCCPDGDFKSAGSDD
jgi:hypothetical protein